MATPTNLPEEEVLNVDLQELTAEAIDHLIDDRLTECRKMLNLGEGEGRMIYLDDPHAPGVQRVYGIQAPHGFALCKCRLGFIPGQPSFTVYFGEPIFFSQLQEAFQ